MVGRARLSSVEIEIVPGKRPDQRRNNPVDHEEVPVEPQEVVVQEDREVEQQQAAPGEVIAEDNEERPEPIVAEQGQEPVVPRRSTRSRRKPDKLRPMMCNAEPFKEVGRGSVRTLCSYYIMLGGGGGLITLFF